MTIPEDRPIALELVSKAVERGASQRKACEVLDIDERTVRRWKRQLETGNGLKDRRKEASGGRVPANRLTEEEKARIIEVCNQEEHRSSAPSQIVPRLADARISSPRNRAFIGYCTRPTNSITEAVPEPPGR